MKSSIRRTSTAAAVACVAASLLATAQTNPPAQTTPPNQQPQPVFRAGTNLVTVDAYPQRDGKIVTDLTPDDFEVFEDGKPQKVETFNFIRIEPTTPDNERRDPNTVAESLALAADPKNRVFALYLDVYHVTIAGSHDLRRPMTQMIENLVAPDDLFGIMTPYLRPRDLSLGRRVLAVEEQLNRYWPWGQRDSIQRDPADAELEQCFNIDPLTGRDWIVNDGASQRRLADVMVDRRREDATLSHLEQFVTYLGSIREARKALLLVSPGWVLFHRDDAILGQIQSALRRIGGPDGPATALGNLTYKSAPSSSCDQLAMHLLSLDDQQRLRELIDFSNRNNVTFYPISPNGLQVFDTPINQSVGANPNAPPWEGVLQQEIGRTRDRSSSARTLAENTDGIAVVDTNNLRDGLQRIVDDQSAYYLLGYYSTNTKTDGKYRHIEVKMKKPGLKVKARRGYVAMTTESAASSAAASIAAAGKTGPSPTDTALRTLTRLDKEADLLTYGVAAGTDLVVVAEISSAQFERSGWAQGADAQAIVTDAAGTALGTIKGRIEPGARSVSLHVPLGFGAGPWRVVVKVDGRDAALDDRLEVAPSAGTLIGDVLAFRGTPAAQSVLRPVADFQFRRTERVHLEWPELQPLDQRTARLLDRKGQPLPIEATLTERTAPAGTVLAADVNLGPLAPADYLIDVTVGHGADSEHRVVAFRIVR
jgi:VWFA-related protein